MDTCCLNRPFDNFDSDIVRFEAEAVVSIISNCEKYAWKLCASDVLYNEIIRIANVLKRDEVLALFNKMQIYTELTNEISLRGEELESFGIKSYDALHLASAELGGADVLLTCDRRFINAAERSNSKIPVKNPLRFIMEVL
jgi:predicted nucleic acid-binding protein